MPPSSPQRTPIATALVAAALLCSCAANRPPQPAPSAAAATPAVGRFIAPPARVESDTWLGSYSGTADICLPEREVWQRAAPIQHFVQSDSDSTLRILGHMDLSASRSSFYIGHIAISPTQLLAGTYSEEGPLSSSRYDYSLTRSGDAITGFVKMHQRSGTSSIFIPGDEWHFNAARSTLPSFR